MNANASSGLGVTYSVASAPQSIAGNQFTIPGAGQFTVVATQAGNSVYSPAQASQTFTVAQASLTVTAQNASRPTDTANPVFAAIVPYVGFVNGDTQSSINGSPAFTTTAQPYSPPDKYPIVITQGTLMNPNYAFNFVNGTLTVAAGGPTADYTVTAAPQSLTMQAGQIRQTTITPTNFYDGLVNLSCGNLPKNVTCTFTPSSLSLEGTNTPASTLLTVSTGTAVVGRLRPPDAESTGAANVRLAGFFLWPGAATGFLLLIVRRSIKSRPLALSAVLLLAAGICACGSKTGLATSGGNPGFAAPGTSTISVTVAAAAGGTSHALPISITVE